jgi:hypothetical protein
MFIVQSWLLKDDCIVNGAYFAKYGEICNQKEKTDGLRQCAKGGKYDE